jgi:hypothetical protein
MILSTYREIYCLRRVKGLKPPSRIGNVLKKKQEISPVPRADLEVTLVNRQEILDVKIAGNRYGLLIK